MPISAFVVWTLVTALVSARPADSLFEAKSAGWLLSIWIVAIALGEDGAPRRWFVLLCACVAVVAALSIVQVAACPAAPPPWPVLGRFFRKCGRAHGFYSIYMTLAGVLLLVLTAALPWLVTTARRRRLGAVAWFIGVVALGVTYVRGAWIGVAAGVAASVLLMRRRAALRFAAVAVVVVAAAAVPEIVEEIRSPGPRWVLDDTSRDRLAMFDGGLHMIADHPLTGVGPGQVKRTYPQYATREALRRSTSHLHNTPLQMAVERGVPGLLLWLSLFGAFFVRAAAIYRRLTEPEDRAIVGGVIAAIIAFLVAGVFEYNFGDTEVLLVVCALMALPFAMERALARPERQARTPAVRSRSACGRSTP